MEAVLMEIVGSLNRSLIYNPYFSLYRAIHSGGKVRGKCPGKMCGYPLMHRGSSTTFPAGIMLSHCCYLALYLIVLFCASGDTCLPVGGPVTSQRHLIIIIIIIVIVIVIVIVVVVIVVVV